MSIMIIYVEVLVMFIDIFIDKYFYSGSMK